MAVKLEEIKVGMIASVRGGFGRDPARDVIVTGVHEEIKNGMGGIDYDSLGSNFSGWAYLNQVDSVRPAEVKPDCTNTVSITVTVDYDEVKALCELQHNDKTGIICHMLNESFQKVHDEYGEGNIDSDNYIKFRDLEVEFNT